jgi:integrase
MHILPNTEWQRVQAQAGGWANMARKRHQQGTLRKRGKREPHWEVQFWADYLTPEGKLARKQVIVALGPVSEVPRKQARTRADEIVRPYNSGKVSPFATIPFSEFVDTHFPMSLRVLKPSTRSRYLSTIKVHLRPAFGDVRLCDIHTVDIQRFVLQKFDSGFGWEVCNHLRNLLSKIFNEAKRLGQFNGDNPASSIQLPEKIPVRGTEALSFEQVGQLLQELKEPVRTMALLAVLTGLRIGELLALRWEHVDLDKGNLRVTEALYRGIHGTPKTKGSKRLLPLPPKACIALREHRERCGITLPEDLIFRSNRGTAFNDSNLLLRHLKPAGEAIGAPWIAWHTFRRTHATLLINSGATAKDAQAQLGHASINTTLGTYVQPMPQHQRESVEKLAQLVPIGASLPLIGASKAKSNVLEFRNYMHAQ